MEVALNHPTQALLDAYTIWKRLGRLDNLTVIIGGDLANGRTCRFDFGPQFKTLWYEVERQ